ncbi:MAG: acyltransferase [Oscillospiraceae bacterium]|jgi:peptidoglycan/LPS O-acetylase OafA/YrhL|nr:acyltransferase [Oscillospiraceae bacterium]
MITENNTLPVNEAIPEKRLIEVDILRGFAMLAVISIHVSNIPLTNLASSRWYLPVYLFNRFLIFAVPVFIIVSAMLAAYTENGRPTQLFPYYKKKLIRILLPYLAWSLFYIAFNLATRGNSLADLLSLKNWVSWILQGRAYIHLYYLAVIIQFFILFPLLIKLARLVKDRPLWAILIIAGGFNIVYWSNKLWLYKLFPYFQSSFFWYFGVIFTGLYVGLNFRKVCVWLQKYIIPLTALCIASAIVFVYLNYLIYKHVRYHTFFYNAVGQIYYISMAFCLLVWSQRIRARQWKVRQGLLWIGRYTMGIYLAHPVLNYFLGRLVKSKNVILLFLICAAAVFAYTVICGYITKYLEKFRPTAWLVGATTPALRATPPQEGNRTGF